MKDTLMRLAILFVALVAILFLTACGKGPVLDAEIEQPPPEPVPGVTDVTSEGERWGCFALSDYNKKTTLFALTRMRIGSQEFGEVSVADTIHPASFKIAGLNRRWDFDYDRSREIYTYAFLITPDGTGLYYDFSTSPDGKASSRDSFKCLMSP